MTFTDGNIGHVAVLIDYVRKVVELITDLEIVGTPLGALVISKILIELLMLIRIQLRVALQEWSGRSSARLLECCR